MKRIVSIVLIIVATLCYRQVMAAPVDEAKALKVAYRYCQMHGAGDMRLVNISSALPFHEFYTFVGVRADSSASPHSKGFVLVSADDCVVPILGFSANNIFDTKDMPPHVREWLDDYEAQIRFYRDQQEHLLHSSQDEINDIVKSRWDALLSDNPPMPPQYTSVEPLLTTEWGQYPLYNSLCPYDSSYSTRTVTGCVATAVAQVMKYWNYPDTGYGSHSYTHASLGTQSANFGNTGYAWSNMPDSLNSSSSTTEVNAVATLMYHVGVAVEMIYGVSTAGGSGAYTQNEGRNPLHYGTTQVPSAENALRYFFKYRSNAHHITYTDFTNETWCSILQNELNNGRPILYTGRDTANGHSFVCDGYNNSGEYHFNWGWRGHYNGYFAIGSLNPGSSSSNYRMYNLQNSAVVSIRPNNDYGDTTIVSASPSNSSMGYGTVTGGGSYTGINDTLVTITATAATGCRFLGWTDGFAYTPRTFYASGGSYNCRANFLPLTGDTLGYCATRHLCSYGSSGTTVWGIKIPAANLTAGHDLTKVHLYINSAGSYMLKVYTGSTSSPTLVHTQSFNASSSLTGRWCALTLTANVPIDGTQPLWIMLESTASYPAACSYFAGNNDSRVWGSLTGILSGNFSFMIKGLFTSGANDSVIYGDTVSFCNDADYDSPMGFGPAAPFDWAVKLPANMVRHRSYVSDVMLYVTAPGSYTLNLYRGLATTSVTQVATQTATFDNSAVGSWQTIHLATPVATNNTLPIWIAFHTDDIAYPAASCAYTGDSNSSLVSTDSCNSWLALSTAMGSMVSQSWMIRAILSDTVATSVIIDGPTSVGVGIPATFTAAGPNTATYTWTLTGAAHSSTSNNTATATWVTPGTYNVIVAANNGGTLLRDTMSVTVFGCTMNTFPYTMGFEGNEPMACWNIIDNDGDGYSWDYGASYFGSSCAHNGTNCFASGSYINNVGALTPDNWLVSPQLQLTADNSYTLTWYDAAMDSAHCQESYAVYVSTTGNNVSNFTTLPLFSTTLSTTAYTQRSIDLSAYAGQNIYIAFRHNTSGMYWLLIDDISITESTADTYYTVTVQSNNPEMGSTTGSGTYLAGTVTTITATANSGYRFVQWNDGNTNAIRAITVNTDATYTAYFEAVT